MALGGYQGWDRILTPSQLAHLVANGTVRFFYLQAGGTGGFQGGQGFGGQFGQNAPGGAGSVANQLAATNDDLINWAQSTCKAVSASTWQTSTAGGSTTAGSSSGGAGAGFFGGGGLQLYDCAGAK
jgi:hypothetical protein